MLTIFLALQERIVELQRTWKAGGGSEASDVERILHLQRQLAKAETAKKTAEMELQVLVGADRSHCMIMS